MSHRRVGDEEEVRALVDLALGVLTEGPEPAGETGSAAVVWRRFEAELRAGRLGEARLHRWLLRAQLGIAALAGLGLAVGWLLIGNVGRLLRGEGAVVEAPVPVVVALVVVAFATLALALAFSFGRWTET